MIAVIFEVLPHAGRKDAYLDAAARLKPLLEKMDGFISIERFESLTQPGKILSLSIWRDEAAVKQWRSTEQHRAAQAAGRAGIFADYRLRIASVIRDYGMNERRKRLRIHAPCTVRPAGGVASFPNGFRLGRWSPTGDHHDPPQPFTFQHPCPVRRGRAVRSTHAELRRLPAPTGSHRGAR